MLAQHMIRSGLLLAVFGLVGTALVALTHEGTKGRIAQAEREAMLRNLHTVIRPEDHDNNLATDVIHVTDPDLLGTRRPVAVYRARRLGQAAAVVIMPTAPDGYSGDINLLIGIDYEGKVLGVRVVSHHETPGLGDFIDERRSRWIFQFDQRSLSAPTDDKWRVKRDGGAFDQVTGATVTSRALVKAVHKALLYYTAHRDQLFATPAEEAPHG